MHPQDHQIRTFMQMYEMSKKFPDWMKGKVNFVSIPSERYQEGNPLSKHLTTMRVFAHHYQAENYTTPIHTTERLYHSFFPRTILSSKNSLVCFNYNFIFIFISSLMEHCNSCICKNVDIKHYYNYYYYHYIMDTGLKLGRGSLITIV